MSAVQHMGRLAVTRGKRFAVFRDSIAGPGALVKVCIPSCRLAELATNWLLRRYWQFSSSSSSGFLCNAKTRCCPTPICTSQHLLPRRYYLLFNRSDYFSGTRWHQAPLKCIVPGCLPLLYSEWNAICKPAPRIKFIKRFRAFWSGYTKMIRHGQPKLYSLCNIYM